MVFILYVMTFNDCFKVFICKLLKLRSVGVATGSDELKDQVTELMFSFNAPDISRMFSFL